MKAMEIDRLSILIVDDDELDRMTLRRNLKRHFPNIELTEADSLEVAEEIVSRSRFDCIFVDYLLPGGDGLSLLKLIREQGIDEPVIMVTSQGDEKIAVEVMKSGASDYIQKGILNTEILGQVLRNALRAHALESERKSTAKKLEESQARLYEAQRIANIGSWEMDLSSKKQYWSDQIYRILGYTEPSDNLPDLDLFLRHIHPDHIAKAEKAMRDCIIEGKLIHFDMLMRTVQGTTRYAEIHGHAVRNEEGWTIKVVGTLQDITHRKETEQALIEARDEAQHLAKAKEEFLANMSHEIRTPMNAIIGYTKLLQKTTLDATQKEYLTAIDHAGQTLIAIINDILDLSRIESGRMEFEHHSFSLKDLLNSLNGMFAVRSAEKSIPISIHLADDVPDRICGDPVRLNQILINLVGNALKFTEEGRVDVWVSTSRVEGKNVFLRFEVVDTGIGIDPAMQKAVFESFTQASSDTTRKYGGSGLGLTISKRLVDLQNGHIGLKSKPGEGSTFFFELPFSPCKTIKEGPSVPVAFAATKLFTTPLRVLVADDIELNQKLAVRILENAGHSVSVASTGSEAVELVRNGGIDLVLMDIQMPEMDGYQATFEIRQLQDPKLNSVPIVALTAHAMPDQIAKIKDSGFSDVISKPFQPEQLLAMIQKLCNTDSPVDLGDVESLAAGDESLKNELIEIFKREVPASLAKMEIASQSQDLETIKRTLHALKPSLLLFKVRDSKALIRSLEEASERADITQTAELISGLSAVTREALHALS